MGSSFISHATIRAREKCLVVRWLEQIDEWDAIGAIGTSTARLRCFVAPIFGRPDPTQRKDGRDTAFRDVFAVVTTQFASMAEGPNAEIMLKGLKKLRQNWPDGKVHF